MLVAPLNWGLGHASRCIPIINALLKANYQPILASDGEALLLLQKEFPFLKCYTLPSYNITYSKSSKYLKYLLLLRVPSLISVLKKERKEVEIIVEEEQISGIISDNRFGVFSKKIPSVYVTHQLNVLSGITTFFSSKIHQRIFKKFCEVWIPDVADEASFSGKLSQYTTTKLNKKYIGIQSRFRTFKSDFKYDVLVLLSGPEPQRSLLENKLLSELKNFNGKVLFVRGVLSDNTRIKGFNTIEVVNYLLAEELNRVICKSAVIIARSGYSTIMDLAVLGKKAYFIPTPGQFEQEYLAELMHMKRIAPFSKQQDFTLDKLTEIENYKGFKLHNSNFDLKLFQLFKSE